MSNSYTFYTSVEIVPAITVTPSATSIAKAQPLNLTVAVSGGGGHPTVTGTVSVYGGYYPQSSQALTNGIATITIPAGSLTVGNDLLTVVYESDYASLGTYTNNTGSIPVAVSSTQTPTVSVTPVSYSAIVSHPLSVTVAVAGAAGSPVPTGSIALNSGTYASSSVAMSGGSATIVIPANSLAVGSDTLAATYSPDTAGAVNFTGAAGISSAVTVTRKISTPTVTALPNASNITTAQALSVSVYISGDTGNPAPTGSVQLSGGGYTSATTTLINAGAKISIPAGSLATGSDILTANYTPDSNSSSIYNSATGISPTVTVTAAVKATPTVTMTPSATNITATQALTVPVAVSGGIGNPAPTGTVTLSSGSYSAQQTLVSGAASFTIAGETLAGGADTLTASYSGDANYAVASATIGVTVEPVSITTTVASPASLGGSTTSTLTLAGGNGYSATISLSCSLTGAPSGAQSLPTCTLDPSTVTLVAGGSGTSTMTVNTTAASTTALTRPSNRPFWKLGGGSAVLAAFLFFGIHSRRRRWISVAVLLVLICTAGAIGCGGGASAINGGGSRSSTPATTAGSYTFTVAGIDLANAKITVSKTVSVTVQ